MALRGPCSGERSSTSVTSRSGDAFTFRRKTARVKAMELDEASSSHDNGLGGRKGGEAESEADGVERGEGRKGGEQS